MLLQTKQRPEQHKIDTRAQALLTAALPENWLLHEYRPDYGIDYALEIFHEVPGDAGSTRTETMGEHLFIQLKGCKKARRRNLTVRERYNVEKFCARQKNGRDVVGNIEVISFPLEVSELRTVQCMGAAVPVLLVVADLSVGQCYFVCLNDYIDKVLIPEYDDYARAKTRTIYVPSRNNLSDPVVGITAVRWYAKRPKLFAAFQKFVYQHAELGYAANEQELFALAKHFASLLIRYDFWDDTEMWAPIPNYGAVLRRFIETGKPGMTKVNEDELQQFAAGNKQKEEGVREWLRTSEIENLWRVLAVLPRNYEELCREWFLPTPLSLRTSYP